MNDILCLLTTLNILDRLLKILLILLNNQVCIIDWNVMDTGSTNEMTSIGTMTTTSDASRDDEKYMHASRDENKHYVKKQTPEEVQEENSEYNESIPQIHWFEELELKIPYRNDDSASVQQL